MSERASAQANIERLAILSLIDDLLDMSGPERSASDALTELRGLVEQRADQPALIDKLTPEDELRAAAGRTVTAGNGNVVTPRQLTAIRTIANSQGINAERKCLEVLGCTPERLSRRAASAFIDYLRKLPRQSRRATSEGS